MSKPFLHRLAIGAALVVVGADLLAAGRSAGVAWALIVWALFIVATTPANLSSPDRRGRKGAPAPRP
jgi:uncharacterized protein (DUF58 family)